MRTVGIIGGLGPLAGAHFYRRLIEFTRANSDHEHIPVVLISDPEIPSRIAHLSGEGESPLPKLTEICKDLLRIGVDIITIPSSTTSIYQAQLEMEIGIPIVSLVKEVTCELSRNECKRVGILGTTPTQTFRVYNSSLEQEGIEVFYPDRQSQSELMRIIHVVKGEWGDGESAKLGGTEIKLLGNQIAQIVSRPWASSLDGVLLGCTELPVLFSDSSSPPKFGGTLPAFSSTDILARAVVRLALG